MRLAVFRTVKGRLLALMVIIAVPIAALCAIAAIVNYRTVVASFGAARLQTAENFAIRARVWYRGSLRSLLATAASIEALQGEGAACTAATDAVLRELDGYEAIRITKPGRAVCESSVAPSLTSAAIDQLVGTQRAKPLAPLISAGTELARLRYDHVRIGGAGHLVIYARGSRPGAEDWEGVLLIRPAAMQQVFGVGGVDPDLVVGLVNRGSDVILARGSERSDGSWLPREEVIPGEPKSWTASSVGGSDRAYSAQLVAEPDIYVIASFGTAANMAAQMQLYFLIVTPLLMLALLILVYTRAIDTHCVRWLRGIEAAARARVQLSTARAAVSEDMPLDVRKVADAFNTMVDEQEVRQRKLQAALDDNRYLVGELHHRVKNSLQVVQSYVGLSKRDYQGEARLALADAECRIHVLSAAYRFTLADGEMQPVRIDVFVDDVLAMVSSLIRGRNQWIATRIETTASLPVDRIIPLGFLVVDVLARALRPNGDLTVSIDVVDLDDSTFTIALKADRPVSHQSQSKLFAGLLRQIEAVEIEAPEGAALGTWRVSHRI